jgi:1-acyl-sn-glycerol-3-phosphate acyltransferase
MAEIETASIPMVASVLRALEFVLVDKSSSESRAQAGKDMTSKLNEKDAPQFLVFAEGQTSDGRQVLAFKDGAFRLGHTVQPVAVRYRRSSYDPTNNPTNMVWHFIRATFDLHHGMDVEFLDVTSKDVDESPSDFAGRVRTSIAECLQVPLSNHSHDDQRLQRRCRKLYKRPPSDLAWAMPETRTCKLVLGLDLDACTEAAKVYLASDLDVKDVDAYRIALDVSEADAAALWASRAEGAALAYRECLVAAALRRCAS